MRISDWSSDVCSSDLEALRTVLRRDGPDALPDALAAAAHDNPLLQAWGAAGRAFDAQLFAYDLVQPSTETELYREPPRDTLLHALQAHVFARTAPAPPARHTRDQSTPVPPSPSPPPARVEA